MNCHFLYIMEHLCRFRKVPILLGGELQPLCLCEQNLFICVRLQESPSFFATKRTVAIFPLSPGDNEVPVHLASDRLIKNVIGSVNHVLAQHGVGLAGGRAAVAVTGGRLDNRITAENEGIKGEEAIVTQSPPKHGCHPEALGTVTEACDCWVLLERWGGVRLSLGSCAFRMWL